MRKLQDLAPNMDLLCKLTVQVFDEYAFCLSLLFARGKFKTSCNKQNCVAEKPSESLNSTTEDETDDQ
ncbi:hypothetical protein QVD17_41437 [Tagetes erecta]|uniref:Uncharacterized protein n=1 Tax=Tagetes erecta TaxID=13708 RepID=A0AAD8JQQ3_TARER|nr:hypothetical protein QVD17_41437 [Tagetes erecta]